MSDPKKPKWLAPIYWRGNWRKMECETRALAYATLTAAGLVKGVGRNFITMSWHRFRVGLWKAGLLTTPDGARLSIRGHWTWTPWRTLADRKEKR